MAQEIIIPESLKKKSDAKQNNGNIVFPENLTSKKINVPNTLKPKIKFGENVFRTLVGAARDVAQSSVELGYDIYEYATVK